MLLSAAIRPLLQAVIKLRANHSSFFVVRPPQLRRLVTLACPDRYIHAIARYGNKLL